MTRTRHLVEHVSHVCTFSSRNTAVLEEPKIEKLPITIDINLLLSYKLCHFFDLVKFCLVLFLQFVVEQVADVNLDAVISTLCNLVLTLLDVALKFRNVV